MASFNPTLSKLENDLLKLEQLLIRPGVRFSDEMLAALFLGCGLIQVSVPRQFGWKGLGPLWLEEEDEIEPTVFFKSCRNTGRYPHQHSFRVCIAINALSKHDRLD